MHQLLVAMEDGLAARVLEAGGHRELGRGARALALLLHRRLEARHVDHHAALAADVGGQVDREAEGVVEAKHRLAVEQALAGGERRLEHAHAVLERLGEALLLLLQHIRDPLLRRAQFGIRIAHGAVEVGYQPIEEGLLLAELVAVADRAADDPAQHITAPLVARDHAVDDEEAAGADVVRDHVERWALQVLGVRLARCRLDQILEEIDLIVRVLALQHRGDALEPHAGIDRRPRQRLHVALLVAVVLHEDEIPDLDVAIAVGIRRSRRSACDARTVVVEDLAARTARAGVGHLPEVVGLEFRAARLVADAYAALLRHADHLGPELVRLIVRLVHRSPKLLRRQLVDLGEQLPRKRNGVLLEVIAEREVAEHLEERVVARGVADVLEIVVLAAGAQAALRRGRALIRTLVLAEEHVLELHHPGVDEQQRGIVRRHERARGHDRVALRAEILEEARADLVRLHSETFYCSAAKSPGHRGRRSSPAALA